MFSSNTSQVSNDVNYIEDVFSTYLYTGNGSTQTINNGIDLAGKGGMVWIKDRNSGAKGHNLWDTSRGAGFRLQTQSTVGQNSTAIFGVSSFNSSGFTLGSNNDSNDPSFNFASWTFRKQPKFFDVVTYTGNGSSGQTVSHNLGSVPGCIIVKRTDSTGNWVVYHQSLSYGNSILLNSTAAQSFTNTDPVGSSTTQFFPYFVGGTGNATNTNGATYVAYIFAHNAGGFGLTGTDNVISCGAITMPSASNFSVNLGWEPQWLLVKRTDAAGNWLLIDEMRGFYADRDGQVLNPNLSIAESTTGGQIYKAYPSMSISSTSFGGNVGNGPWGAAGSTYIYIAIRRGPMKTPTTGTSVFASVASSAASGTALTTNFPVDTQFGKYRSGSASWSVVDRLRGVSTTSTEMGLSLATNSTAAEGTASGGDSNNWGSTGFSMPSNLGGISDIFYNFRRAPGFFDEVCYTGTGTAGQTYAHNLTVVPELMIVKRRNSAGNGWATYCAPLGNTAFLYVNSTGAADSGFNQWNNTSPTATQFSVSTSSDVNASGGTYVAYLFASCPGVSKVGSYTGTGATQVINCGFTTGARFVLIKRTDSTGDWYVWDAARGIVAGNDPYLLLNSTAAEVTTTDYVDTFSSGFEISSTAPAVINASGGTFIYLAIA